MLKPKQLDQEEHDILETLMEKDSIRKQPLVEDDTSAFANELLEAQLNKGPGDEDEVDDGELEADFDGFTEE